MKRIIEILSPLLTAAGTWAAGQGFATSDEVTAVIGMLVALPAGVVATISIIKKISAKGDQ